jgi:hypothetical protein
LRSSPVASRAHSSPSAAPLAPGPCHVKPAHGRATVWAHASGDEGSFAKCVGRRGSFAKRVGRRLLPNMSGERCCQTHVAIRVPRARVRVMRAKCDRCGRARVRRPTVSQSVQRRAEWSWRRFHSGRRHTCQHSKPSGSVKHLSGSIIIRGGTAILGVGSIHHPRRGCHIRGGINSSSEVGLSY